MIWAEGLKDCELCAHHRISDACLLPRGAGTLQIRGSRGAPRPSPRGLRETSENRVYSSSFVSAALGGTGVTTVLRDLMNSRVHRRMENTLTFSLRAVSLMFTSPDRTLSTIRRCYFGGTGAVLTMIELSFGRDVSALSSGVGATVVFTAPSALPMVRVESTIIIGRGTDTGCCGGFVPN